MALVGQPLGYANSAPAPEEPFLSEMLKLVADAVERASLIRDRLERIEARVFGADPCETASGLPPKVVPCGSAGELRDRLSDLQAILLATAPVIDKLDRIA